MSKSYDEKKTYATNYIKAMREIEELMEPLKEAKRELREEYHQQGWLSRPEMASVVRAYRLVQQSKKGKICLDELFEHVGMFDNILLQEKLQNEAQEAINASKKNEGNN